MGQTLKDAPAFLEGPLPKWYRLLAAQGGGEDALGRRAGWQDRAQQAALSSRGPLFLSPVCQPPLAAWLCGLWTGEASVPRQWVPGLGPSTGSPHTLRSGRCLRGLQCWSGR